ncbi:oxygenase MpaB family protein [Novosphingobium pentaromativorans]|uniref:ER-bound oxygenase mpaB/mpaB'/Rubber oxygenase catalytic domain-containing protein n=1 Tax=Novosphingobium pentaromativorans US6-1 TaxID=1088721 RepID=G6EHA6_9SPHN|nr:oxygenase MpaB family protein [Novosphingobium pentaromativorans]AIT81928.1 histidine kinase [Novosphingobium pentaromativorans US6-1]EHJ59395.1 hypothetical protein NSU_3727 [Novosphingobium pentaromativorans US6-1]
MDRIRRSIAGQVHALIGSRSGEIDRDRVAGDQGLFGPSSVTWRVHGDFTTMMIGGLSALLLQMLHPRVLAGVWDHSNFREDPLGRLRRTAQFVSGTTYGSTRQALALIEQINAIHDRVRGHLPDGTPYHARDPDLLTWVHVTSATSFLRAYVRYRDPLLPFADQDKYLAEMSEIAHRLGAENVPTSLRQCELYFEATRPQLKVDGRTREVAHALLSPRPSRLGPRLFRTMSSKAAIDLLPHWAARMHRLSVQGPERLLVRSSAQGAQVLLHWALRDRTARRAMEESTAS